MMIVVNQQSNTYPLFYFSSAYITPSFPPSPINHSNRFLWVCKPHNTVSLGFRFPIGSSIEHNQSCLLLYIHIHVYILKTKRIHIYFKDKKDKYYINIPPFFT